MRDRTCPTLLLALAAAALVATPPGLARGQGLETFADQPRKVLVELYTSQGCNSCPPASDLLARFAALGYGPDRVVPLNFHVDYFNTPWADTYADPSFSARELAYNQVLKRTDLYFTPMMMVDGQYPLLGSNRTEAEAAIRRARQEPALVRLDLALAGDGPRKEVTVKLATKSPAVAGREILVAVALTEDRVSTRVPAGENAGKTLVETDVVRHLDHRFARLDRLEPKSLAFPVTLPPGADPAHFRVAVFAQDRANGHVYQADAIPWAAKPPGATAAR